MTTPASDEPTTAPPAPAGGAGSAVPPGYAARPGHPTGPPPAGSGWPAPAWAPRPPAVGPAGQRLADFGQRLLARVIDAALLITVALAVALPVIAAVFAFTVRRATEETASPLAALLVWLLTIAALFLFTVGIGYLYEVELQRRTGQTLGKRVLGIRVVALDPAARFDRAMAARRWLVGLVAGLIPGFGYLDGLWQLWDQPYRQCLHDKFAGTIVVRA